MLPVDIKVYKIIQIINKKNITAAFVIYKLRWFYRFQQNHNVCLNLCRSYTKQLIIKNVIKTYRK